jgi:Tectonin domain
MKSKVITMVFLQLIIFVNYVKADEWRLQPGNARDIAVGANGAVWSIGNTPTDGSFNIQFWTGSNWQNIDGGGVKIAVDPYGNPWVINSANQIFKREANRWVQMPGAAIDIGIGANGDVWVIGTDDNIFGGGGKRVYKLVDNNWKVVEGGGVKITVAPNGQPFIVNNGGIIYERLTAGNWKTYPGQAYDISIGANGSLWVIGRIIRGGGSYSVHKWSGSNWEEIDGGASQIAVDQQGQPWVTNHNYEIYKRSFTAHNYLASPLIVQNSINYIMSGRVSTLAVNPVNHNHVIAAGETGGLFETTTAASRGPWRHLTEFKNNSITDVLIVPGGAAGNEIWVTTNVSYDNNRAPQIWKRSYTGVWSRATISPTALTTFENSAAYRIVKSKNSDRLYAFGDFGFAYKESTSDVWLIGRKPNGTIVSIETMQDGTVIAATTTGIYYLADVAGIWQSATSASPLSILSSTSTQQYALKADESGKIALLCNKLTGSGVQIYSTLDYGRTWTRFNSLCGGRALSEGQTGGFQSILPVFNATTSMLSVYVSNSENIHYANVRGATIVDAVQSLQNNASIVWLPGADRAGWGFNANHEDTRQVAILSRGVISPKMIVTSDGGIDLADIIGNQPERFTWPLQINTGGFNALQIYNVTGTNREFYFGTQDNGYGYNNNGNLLTWQSGGGREGYIIEKRGNGFFDDITLVGLAPSFIKNRDGWVLANDCPVSGNPAQWNSPTLNFGVPANYCKDVYLQDASSATGSNWNISYDKGCNWNMIGRSTLPKSSGIRYCFSQPANRNVAISTCFNRSGTIVLGRLEDALIPSTSRLWTITEMRDLAGGIASVNNQFLTNPVFTVNPENPLIAFAAEANTGILKKTSNGGDSWNEVISFSTVYSDGGNASFKSSNGQHSIWNVEYSPYDPNFILVGTVSKGIFFSKDAGDTWQKIIDNVGVYMPTDFHWRSAKEILVATYGRGLFKIVL